MLSLGELSVYFSGRAKGLFIWVSKGVISLGGLVPTSLVELWHDGSRGADGIL